MLALCHDNREITLSIQATTQYLAASGDEGGFHPPTIGEFFPNAIVEFGSFEFNRIHLVRIIAAVVLITLFTLAARRATLFQDALRTSPKWHWTSCE